MTSYEMRITGVDGETYSQPLLATNDAEAIREMTERVKNYERNVRVFVMFFRENDGTRGYLNPDGASTTGKAWYDAISPLRVKY